MVSRIGTAAIVGDGAVVTVGGTGVAVSVATIVIVGVADGGTVVIVGVDEASGVGVAVGEGVPVAVLVTVAVDVGESVTVAVGGIGAGPHWGSSARITNASTSPAMMSQNRLRRKTIDREPSIYYEYNIKIVRLTSG